MIIAGNAICALKFNYLHTSWCDPIDHIQRYTKYFCVLLYVGGNFLVFNCVMNFPAELCLVY